MRLEDGEVCIFNTDTVFGIGCKYLDLKAYEKIYELKKRPTNKQMPVLFSNILQIDEIAIVTVECAKIMKHFFPGPLTIILNVKENSDYYSINKTIGVRIPKNDLAISLINENGPLATTSVNISSYPPIEDLNEIKKVFQDADYILSNDESLSNISSTIIDMTGSNIKIVRKGSIALEEINHLK